MIHYHQSCQVREGAKIGKVWDFQKSLKGLEYGTNNYTYYLLIRTIAQKHKYTKLVFMAFISIFTGFFLAILR